MKRDGMWLQRLAERADLPSEPLPGMSVAELAEDRRLLIENHRGVTEYSRERISVKVKFGQIRVCGVGLELARMTKEQLVICGRIDTISLIRRGI